MPFAGYEMPVQYTSIIEEHRTVRSAVGLFDLSHMGEIEVTGEEAVAFLRHALASDPGTLEIGQAQYSMACNEDGGIVDDLIVYRRENGDFLVVCNAANRAAVVEQLTSLLDRGDFGASIDDRSDRIGLVAPQGPNAAALVGELTDLDLAAHRQLPLGARAPSPASSAWWRAPATPARTASSCSATPAARRSCGRR